MKNKPQEGLTFVSKEIQRNLALKPKEVIPLHKLPRYLAGCSMTWEFREKLYKFLNQLPLDSE